MGSLQVVRTGLALSADDEVYERDDAPFGRGADVGIGFGLSALFVASAVYGFRSISECREVKQAHALRLETQRLGESFPEATTHNPEPHPSALPPPAPDSEPAPTQPAASALPTATSASEAAQF